MTTGFGAFGKMPSVGDFFRFAAPPGFVAAWDDWIQRGMLDVQTALGGAWDDHYMSTPIWRFCLSPGLAGPQKVIGVLMPSVDRVGRRFPLTLMAALQTPGPAQLDHFCEEPLFLWLEDTALAALDDTMTRERLEQILAAVPPPQFRGNAPVRAAGSSLILTQTGPEGLLPDLAAGLLAGRFAKPSIWSALVNDRPRLMISEGLPQGPDMQGLFNLNAPVWNEAKPV
ncbi:MAG: type VI secretion system protein ImpM [Paracoccaceae bacterium]|jgi:type VI secretion system protein ImpM